MPISRRKKKQKKRRRRRNSRRRTGTGRIESIEEEVAEEEAEKSKVKTVGISCIINIRQKIQDKSGRRNNKKRKE